MDAFTDNLVSVLAVLILVADLVMTYSHMAAH
ncbi:hypothetical protein FERRO_13530 [Ferrovum sp. JA12]|jgi:hypothetical protein|nr:hypothetical protein FERRO_13530 [Ferrovum sp. JA12]